MPVLKEKIARETAKAIAGVFGTLDEAKKESSEVADKSGESAEQAVQKKDQLSKDLRLKQLAHFSPEENRPPRRPGRRRSRVPHVRGDEPSWAMNSMLVGLCSPRAWG